MFGCCTDQLGKFEERRQLIHPDLHKFADKFFKRNFNTEELERRVDSLFKLLPKEEVFVSLQKYLEISALIHSSEVFQKVLPLFRRLVYFNYNNKEISWDDCFFNELYHRVNSEYDKDLAKMVYRNGIPMFNYDYSSDTCSHFLKMLSSEKDEIESHITLENFIEIYKLAQFSTIKHAIKACESWFRKNKTLSLTLKLLTLYQGKKGSERSASLCLEKLGCFKGYNPERYLSLLYCNNKFNESLVDEIIKLDKPLYLRFKEDVLHLNFSEISDECLKILPQLNLPNVSFSFEMNANNRDLDSLCAVIPKLNAFRIELSFARHTIETAEANNLVQLFINNPRIKDIKFEQINIEDNDFIRILDALKERGVLETFSYKFFPLSIHAMSILARTGRIKLGRDMCGQVACLSSTWNEPFKKERVMQEKECRKAFAFASLFENLKFLHSLELDDESIGPEGMTKIVKGIQDNQTLTNLNLIFNPCLSDEKKIFEKILRRRFFNKLVIG